MFEDTWPRLCLIVAVQGSDSSSIAILRGFLHSDHPDPFEFEYGCNQIGNSLRSVHRSIQRSRQTAGFRWIRQDTVPLLTQPDGLKRGRPFRETLSRQPDGPEQPAVCARE
jgi:hypothetical protein